jgi:rare lipoprotein A (peptidoglycan hydrolase)
MGLGSVLVGPSQQRQKVRGHVEANDSAIAADGSGEPVLRQLGLASYYADKYQGQPKANGQPYDAEALTAASRDLPLGTHATVTNQANGKSVDVTIDDRGPTIEGRIIDLSKQAAERLDHDSRWGNARAHRSAAVATTHSGPDRQGPARGGAVALSETSMRSERD